MGDKEDRVHKTTPVGDQANPQVLADEVWLLRETVDKLERQVRESERAARRLDVRDAVTRALAESSSLVEVAP